MPKLIYTHSGAQDEPALYVFSDKGGFLMLSADDCAAPVLGYSDNRTFDPTNIPPQMEWWIGEYTRQIEYAREKGLMQYSSIRTDDRSPIAPLIQTKWDQTAPFNNDCPTVNNKHTLTGCVATAMAQVMNYWQYPDRGKGTATITLPSSDKKETLNLATTSFDWGNMLDSYNNNAGYSEEEANAVAYLMKACGYACDMQYGLNSSGALSMNAASALVENFKYNPNLQYRQREFYDASEWEEMVYQELSAKRPVLYGGQSPSVGHEFVCDGYSSNGYFHFNWGWSGLADGYFLLDALDPSNLGSGGGSGGGFNSNQDIITGLQPETTELTAPMISQFGSLSMTAKFILLDIRLTSGDNAGFWANTGISGYEGTLGVKFEPIDGTPGSTVYVEIGSGNIAAPKTVPNGDGSYQVSYSGFNGNQSVGIPTTLSDGRYKVTVCIKYTGKPDDTYTPVLTTPSAYNYAYMTKTGKNCTIENLAPAELTIEDSEVISPLYFNNATKISITLSNDSEKELTGTYFPLLLSGNREVMSGDGITVTVPAKGSISQEFITTFNLLKGVAAPTEDATYTLVYYNPTTDEVYDWRGDVTMKLLTEQPEYSVSDFRIDNADYVNVNLNNGETSRLYTVEDIEEIPFSCNMSVSTGYFGLPVLLAIFPGNGGNSLSLTSFTETPTLSAGESMRLTNNLTFENGEPDETYMAALYLDASAFNSEDPVIAMDVLPIFFTFKSSSVDTLTEDNDGMNILFDSALRYVSASSANGIVSVTVYSLDGRIVSSIEGEGKESVSIDLSDIPAGVYIVTATDAKGVRKQMKIAR